MLLEGAEVGHSLSGPERRSWKGRQLTCRNLWGRKGLGYGKIVDRGAQVLDLGDPNFPVDGSTFGDGHQQDGHSAAACGHWCSADRSQRDI